MARGPAYPYIDLEFAVKLAQKTYLYARRAGAPLDAVSKDAWNYSPTSSSGIKVFTALKYFGLIESPDNGVTVKITDRAYRIIVDEPDSPDRIKALRDAALAPRWYKFCWENWGSDIPASMKSTLIFTHHFVETTVDGFIKDYKKTIEFAKLASMPIEASSMEQKNESEPSEEFEENKHVQSVPSGQPRRSLPKGIRTPDSGDGMRQDVFSLTEGVVSLEWPSNLSPESYSDLTDWLEIIKRKIKRSVTGRPEAIETKNEEA